MQSHSEFHTRRWMPPVALLLITAVAAALRFPGLASVPPGFHYDEAYEALEAWRVITQPGYHPIFFAGNFGVEPMFIYLTSIAFRLFGATPAIMRAVAALAGTLTVPMVWVLARELVRADDRIPAATPWLAAAALAIMRWHIMFSRVGIEPVLVPLFLVLILWLFWRTLRTGSVWSAIGLGVATGLGPYTYPAGRLLPLAPILATLILLLADRSRLRGRWGRLILAGVMACVTVAPLLANFVAHPDQLLLRSSQIAVGAAPQAGTFWRNLIATLGMFSFAGDMDPRSNPPGMPVLDALMSIPFYLGIAVVLFRWRRPATLSLLGVGALMAAPTVLSEYAPHFRRAIGMAPLVALLSGLGLAMIFGWQRARGRDASPPISGRRWSTGWLRPGGAVRALVVLAILATSGVLSATAYFDRWGKSAGVYYAYDQGLWEIGQYVLSLPSDERVYVSPRPASDTTLAFAWRERPGIRHFDGRNAWIAPVSGVARATYVIIEHEDYRGSRLLTELYPSASLDRTFIDRDGNVYARAYRVDQPAQYARQPQSPLSALWPGVQLAGYDLDNTTYQPGDIVYLQLWWQVEAAPKASWTVFTHVLGPVRSDGTTVWAGKDAQPGAGSAPTDLWLPGELVLDEYQIQLPADIPAGEFSIEVGLYDPSQSGARVPALSPEGADHLIIGSISVTP